jgi:hypothetical protein
MRRNRTLGSKLSPARRFALVVMTALVMTGSALVLAWTFALPA